MLCGRHRNRHDSTDAVTMESRLEGRSDKRQVLKAFKSMKPTCSAFGTCTEMGTRRDPAGHTRIIRGLHQGSLLGGYSLGSGVQGKRRLSFLLMLIAAKD